MPCCLFLMYCKQPDCRPRELNHKGMSCSSTDGATKTTTLDFLGELISNPPMGQPGRLSFLDMQEASSDAFPGASFAAVRCRMVGKVESVLCTFLRSTQQPVRACHVWLCFSFCFVLSESCPFSSLLGLIIPYPAVSLLFPISSVFSLSILTPGFLP